MSRTCSMNFFDSSVQIRVPRQQLRLTRIQSVVSSGSNISSCGFQGKVGRQHNNRASSQLKRKGNHSTLKVHFATFDAVQLPCQNRSAEAQQDTALYVCSARKSRWGFIICSKHYSVDRNVAGSIWSVRPDAKDYARAIQLYKEVAESVQGQVGQCLIVSKLLKYCLVHRRPTMISKYLAAKWQLLAVWAMTILSCSILSPRLPELRTGGSGRKRLKVKIWFQRNSSVRLFR